VTSFGDPEVLRRLLEARMPFGKHKGRYLLDLPEPYVVWLAGQGFPKGVLGRQLALVHEIKVNGLESLLEPLRKGRR
jgi:uncharacterized protein (DUF3820 family)